MSGIDYIDSHDKVISDISTALNSPLSMFSRLPASSQLKVHMLLLGQTRNRLISLVCCPHEYNTSNAPDFYLCLLSVLWSPKAPILSLSET